MGQRRAETDRGGANGLLGAAEAQPWQRLPHILRGYRPSGMSHAAALRTLFGWHNETVNAWSVVITLVAACYVLGPAAAYSTGAATQHGLATQQGPATPTAASLLLFEPLGSEKSKDRPAPAWPLLLVLLALVVFSVASVGQHVFICVSPRAATLWRRLDMCSLLGLQVALAVLLVRYTWGSFHSRSSREPSDRERSSREPSDRERSSREPALGRQERRLRAKLGLCHSEQDTLLLPGQREDRGAHGYVSDLRRLKLASRMSGLSFALRAKREEQSLSFALRAKREEHISFALREKRRPPTPRPTAAAAHAMPIRVRTAAGWF
jgi:hypothetical protein